MRPVSDKQWDVLKALTGYEHPPTARQLADRMETRHHRSARWSYKETHGVLTRLYRKGLVERWWSTGDGLRWEITQAGREALDVPLG